MFKKFNSKFLILSIFVLVCALTFMFSARDTYSRYTYSASVTDVSVTVPASDKCKVYGVDTLGECVILMDNTAETVAEAKSYIESKTYDTSAVEPVVAYLTKTSSVSNSSQTDSSLYYFFILDDDVTNYFSTSTGYYNFSSVSSGSYIAMTMATYYAMYEAGEDLSNYYTMWQTSRTANATTVYQITGINSTVTATSGITTYYYSANSYTNSIGETSASSPGLYAAEDYDGGTTYFFRGSATNNYVYFAGYYWRIIRVNSDGSVRMIYAGTSSSASGSSTSISTASTSAYNSKYNDTTYVGYTYGENFTLIDEDTATSTVTYSNISSTSTYYFSDSYSCTNSSGTYSCSLGSNQISGTWSSVYSDVVSTYMYTCFSTSSTGTCTKIRKVKKYVSATSATIVWLGWTSDTLDDTYGTTNSTIKGKIDTWYATYIAGKSDDDENPYSDYVSDEVFCNDRSLYSTTSMSTSWHNNPITTHTYYSPYYRLYTNRSPSLTCTNEEDMYTVDDTIGNGLLTYPVALITADEASLAGGVYATLNYKYYLYTGQTYWTMSPSHFDATYGSALVWRVSSTGTLYNSWVADSYGVRPVINLSSEVLLEDGTGTASDPYTVKLDSGN